MPIFFLAEKITGKMRNIFPNMEEDFAGLPDVAMLRQRRWKRGIAGIDFIDLNRVPSTISCRSFHSVFSEAPPGT